MHTGRTADLSLPWVRIRSHRQCVATPFAEAPKTAKLQVFESQDILGLIFAWWGIDGRAPQWSLPEDSLTKPAGATSRSIRFASRATPGDDGKLVDLAHLRYVHGYDNVNPVEEFAVDGPRLEAQFDFKSVRKVAGVTTLTFDISAKANIYGLGYSFVEIHEDSIGMDLRLWVLATPVDGTLIDMSLVSQVKEIRSPRRLFAGLGFLPVKMRAPILNKFMAAQQKHDVQQDIVIWSRKQYVPRPRLCRSDGKIMPFRYYCAQFYPDPKDGDGSTHRGPSRL